jgi:hypothetical protein
MSGKEMTHDKGRNKAKKIVGRVKEICGIFTRIGITAGKMG